MSYQHSNTVYIFIKKHSLCWISGTVTINQTRSVYMTVSGTEENSEIGNLNQVT